MGLPFDIVDVESELNKQMLADFKGERTQFLQVGPRKYLMPSNYRKQASEFYNFKLRADDVWICTYPRSGTTVMQEMLYIVANDMNFEKAASAPLNVRSPFLEDSSLTHDDFLRDMLKRVKGDPEKEAAAYKFAENQVPLLDAASSPRIIKTHLPFSILPPDLAHTGKVVYMARNPKDMVTSFYHHNKLVKVIDYVSDFPKFWDYFERNLLLFSPYWEHIHEAWNIRNNPNVLFLFYEDLVKDYKATIRKVSSFLGKKFDEKQISQLAEHLKIDNFRKNSTVNAHVANLPGARAEGGQFVRKGENNSWKAEFTPELNERADKWIAENIARIPGFTFPTC